MYVKEEQTNTNTCISAGSNHCNQHKMSAINLHMSRNLWNLIISKFSNIFMRSKWQFVSSTLYHNGVIKIQIVEAFASKFSSVNSSSSHCFTEFQHSNCNPFTLQRVSIEEPSNVLASFTANKTAGGDLIPSFLTFLHS